MLSFTPPNLMKKLLVSFLTACLAPGMLFAQASDEDEDDTPAVRKVDLTLAEAKVSPHQKMKLEQLRKITLTRKYSFTPRVTSVLGEDLRRITGLKLDDKITPEKMRKQAEEAERVLREEGESQGARPFSTNSLPPAFRTASIPPIRNQLSCGSCWAFSSAAAAEISLRKRFGMRRNLSEQQLIDCGTPVVDGCDGFYPELATTYMLVAGLYSDKFYDYDARDNNRCLRDDQRNNRYKLSTWAWLDFDPFNIDATSAIKERVMRHGSVATCIAATDAFMGYGGDENDVFDEIPESQFNANQLNHAVVIVGWDNAKGAWLVRNSWGTGWGNNGYAWVKYRHNGIGYRSIWLAAKRP